MADGLGPLLAFPKVHLATATSHPSSPSHLLFSFFSSSFPSAFTVVGPVIGDRPSASRRHRPPLLSFPSPFSFLLLLPSPLPSLWRWHDRPGKTDRNPSNAARCQWGLLLAAWAQRASEHSARPEPMRESNSVKEGRPTALFLLLRPLPPPKWPFGEAHKVVGPRHPLFSLSLSLPHQLEAYLVGGEVWRWWRRWSGDGETTEGPWSNEGAQHSPLSSVEGLRAPPLLSLFFS